MGDIDAVAYQDEWKALSGRFRGLMQAGSLHASFLAVRSNDTYGRAKYLSEQCVDVLSALENFRDAYRQSLQPVALNAIEKFLSKVRPLTNDSGGSQGARQEQLWATLVCFSAFETEVSFLLTDAQAMIRSRSERAFVHLQRSIVADGEFRAKWKTAFEEGEVACEGLGAVHLLLHGIWAFKTNAAGARTDLVFQDNAGDLNDVRGYADGLVLTEWKKAGTADQAEQRFAEARAQAQRYAEGILAGIELASCRYAIVVSKEQVDVPTDITERNVLYRHINIAVEPRVPSRA